MMLPVWAIVKKDIRALLSSPMFYFLVGLCTVLWALFFSFQVYSFVQQSYQLSSRVKESGLNIHQSLVSPYILVVHYVLVFVIAALSIRFFAEEKKMKTFPILMSSPMTSWQIVLAKWLVGAASIFLLLTVSAVLPLSLLFFIKIPIGLFLLSYVGLFLVLCLFMTVSMFASVLTESLIVCVVLSLVMTVLLLLMGVGRDLTTSLLLQDFFNFIALDYHFINFRKGMISFSSVFYLISLSGLFAYFTERIVEFHRWR